MADSYQNPREQVATAEIQELFQQEKYKPEHLKNFIRALEEASKTSPRPDYVVVQGTSYALRQLEERLAEFVQNLPDAQRPAITDTSFYNPSFLDHLNSLINEISGLTPTPPPSNIPVNLQELVKIHEAALAAQAAKAPAGTDLTAIFARRRDQAAVIAGLNQIRNAARERLFWAASNSRYATDLAAAMGVRRSAVEGILKQRIDQIVDQAITTQAFRQAQLLTHDPQQLATYFTKQLQDMLKKEGDVAFTALETNKKEKAAALRQIKEIVTAETAKAKHSLEEVGKDVRSHPANKDAATRLAAEAIEKAAVTKLSAPQRERLAGELAKRVGDESAQLRVVARVMPGTTPDQQREVLGKIAPFVEVFAKSADAPSPLEIADRNTILSEVRLHPGRFPAPFVRAVRSGAFSTPESAARVLTLSQELGVSVDAAILELGGVDATRLVLSLSKGRPVFGLPTMQTLSRTDPLMLRFSALTADQARISHAMRSKTLSLPLLRSFQPASTSARRNVNWSEFFRSTNPFSAVSYNFGRVPPIGSIASPIRSFFSGLRVQYGFGRMEQGFRAASRIPFAPFRAVGSMVGRGVDSVKSWAGVKIRSGFARAGAWLAKKGITTAAAKLGGALLSKGTAALLAQAVPIVGQAVGVLTALSAIGDIGKFLWDHKEGAAKLGLGLLVTGGLILKGIFGAIGSAIWGLAGGALGALLGSAFGPVGALAGGFIGTGIGLWAGSGGLASFLSGVGSTIGSAATGIGSFLGALTAPSLTAGLGGTIAAVGIGSIAFGAVVTTFFIQPAINAALFVPQTVGGVIPTSSVCDNPPAAKPMATDIKFSADGKYAFPVASYSRLWHTCSHWNGQPATDIGITGDTAANPPRGEHLPVVAFTSGTIFSVSENDTLGGKNIILQGNDGLFYYYAHNCTLYVNPDDRVNVGDVIATTDNTGEAATTVEHLHFHASTTSKMTTTDPADVANFVCASQLFEEKLNLGKCSPSEWCTNNP